MAFAMFDLSLWSNVVFLFSVLVLCKLIQNLGFLYVSVFSFILAVASRCYNRIYTLSEKLVRKYSWLSLGQYSLKSTPLHLKE